MKKYSFVCTIHAKTPEDALEVHRHISGGLEDVCASIPLSAELDIGSISTTERDGEIFNLASLMDEVQLGSLEIEEGAPVCPGAKLSAGAFVMGWLWVPFEGTSLAEEAEEDALAAALDHDLDRIEKGVGDDCR